MIVDYKKRFYINLIFTVPVLVLSPTIQHFFGDGINDAPALATSDVGIAIGTGTDIAIETAGIILVKNNLLDVVDLLKLSKATTNKIIQNLLWATGYNIFALPIAAGVLYPFGIILTPAVGAMLMSLSTVIASVNAKLLKLD